MTLDEICAKVGGTVAVPVEGAAAESVYVGDLLSDVMGHAGDACALGTRSPSARSSDARSS